MNKAQQRQFHTLYQQHISALQRQGKATTTIDVYSRAVRRVTAYFDQCPDRLTVDQLKIYFTALVKSHSWSTVKVDRNGLQFFFKHVLNKEWIWVDIVKPPHKTVLPDILTRRELERLINGAQELRYQTFILTAYSQTEKTRRLRGEDLIALLLQHTLPKGFVERVTINLETK